MNHILNKFGEKIRLLDSININIEKLLESGDELDITHLISEKNKLMNEIIDIDAMLLRNIEKFNYIKVY